MSTFDEAGHQYELPGLNLQYFQNVSFPNQTDRLELALHALNSSSEDRREHLVSFVQHRLEAYQFIGRCAGVEFPTDLEVRAKHALGITIEY